MEVKLHNVAAAAKIFETFQDKKLSFSTAYKVVKLINELDVHVKFYQDKMMAIIKEYAQINEEGEPLRTENGMGILIKDEYKEQCQMELNELNQLSVDVSDKCLFHMDELNDIEVDIETMNMLMPFIIET